MSHFSSDRTAVDDKSYGGTSSFDDKSFGGKSRDSTFTSFAADDDNSFPTSSKESLERPLSRRESRVFHDFSAKDRKVAGVRRIIYVAILLLGLGVAFLVYFEIDSQERDAFESHFQEDAAQVLQSFTLTIDLAFGALNTFALSMASFARATNQTWPKVMIPDFGARAETTRGK